MANTPRGPALAVVLALIVVRVPTAAHAQTPVAPASAVASTRADLLSDAREAKAKQLEPPSRPGLTTRVWDFLESSYGPGSAQWNGVTPRFGSVVSGGGFAVGARYRNTLLFDRRAELRLDAMGSIKQYYTLGGAFSTRRLGNSPLFARAEVAVREYPEEDFFGLGPDASRRDRTTFLYREFRAGGSAGVALGRGVSIGGGLTFVNPGVGRGRDAAHPSIDERFTEAAAPGLAGQPDFLLTSVFLDVDRVGSPEQTRTGGAVKVTVTHASDRGSGAHAFRQLDVDARHYFPFLYGKRVVVLRGVLSTTDTDAGATVPFYMQPFLGGRRSLRGFDDQRFRGPHLMLLQAEYRFEVWPALDMALFYDAGKVALRRTDLDFSHLERDYGISFRFGGEQSVVRVDVAFGGETRRFSVAFGDVF